MDSSKKWQIQVQPWENKKPVTVTVTIEPQCHPVDKRIKYIRDPIHQVCIALLQHGQLKPYQVQQALDSVSAFWTAMAAQDATLEDFDGS
jgi:hypothetical protein